MGIGTLTRHVRGAPADAEPQRASPTHELGVHQRALLTLVGIGFLVWWLFAWTGYGKRYPQTNLGFSKGSSHLLELTLVREDIDNLACASDLIEAGLRCGYRANGEALPLEPDADRRTLRPYNTIKNELLLAAGLWSSAALRGPLPRQRFTVVCNYQVTGVVKSAALRWSPSGAFEPLKQSVALGSLSNCQLPR